ncbi:DNA methyltransferase [Luteimonas sp. FCS-9]|uniref:DNA methyltransferase n=1 Tax=Luteimonas sp. FCS-9 TaxID=1547516 RepID=UPI00063E841D|nr:DNA methyltransferase [Luteimonas sp. FCS-9]KLJ02854.1 DNA methyltransferase [Luteimonas sp. FCS-9]
MKALGQHMTPDWAAAELVDRYFADLGADDHVLEPTCGRGAFLRAVPEHVAATGVEIDPDLAAIARANTGRPVIVGDFRMVDLRVQPTAVVGNPPFVTRTIGEILERCWQLLPDEGRVGMILPAYCLQTASTTVALAERWSIRQDMLPRNLFGRLVYPICFAVLTKGAARGLVGFALYHEQHAVTRLRTRYRALLASGEGSAWVAITRAAMEALGGRASLQQLYREIDGHRPTPNPFWQAKVRQTVQRIAVRVDAGVWALPPTLEHAAA